MYIWINRRITKATQYTGETTTIIVRVSVTFPEILLKPSQAKPSQAKPSQAKVLTGGGDLREAQVDVPLSVSHSCD